MYNVMLAIHIIGFVCWFAGLFYIYRLYIYHTEAGFSPNLNREILQRQFIKMQGKLLYGITHPAMAITLIAGVILMILLKSWTQPWFYIKATLLVLFLVYHFYTSKIYKKLKKGLYPLSSLKLRLLNEVATIFLLFIVFTAKLKDVKAIMQSFIYLAIFSIFILFLTFVLNKQKINKRRVPS